LLALKIIPTSKPTTTFTNSLTLTRDTERLINVKKVNSI